ncbi:MAG: hypothetical protein K1X75_08245 [Leptospirales bacterium]|nr:hypothetical protein [Leptospirales bacterium]
MQNRPDAAELLEAIQEFLMKDIMPRVKDQELLSFKTLVSWNMLGVLAREARSGEDSLNSELGRLIALLGADGLQRPETGMEKMSLLRRLNRQLAQKIRTEKIGFENRAVADHVRRTVSEKLSISNPRFSQES